MEKQQSPKLSSFVGSKINSLLKNQNESYVRASLANLRRGIGKRPGSLPAIWELTLNGLPKTFNFETTEPTYEEWAAHMAITLFALHQQGKEPHANPMSKPERPLGAAVRDLIIRRGESSEDAIKRRFDAVVTSDSPEELAHHLRGIIQLLKSEGTGIPLDYPQLAEELFKFQRPESRDNVKLKWARDYYKIKKSEENHDE